MSRSILVLNKTGGVGKTTITELLHAYFLKELKTYGLMSIDSDDENDSKLSDRHRDAIALTVSPDGHSDWSLLASGIADGNMLIDFGANTISVFRSWIENYDLGSLVKDENRPVMVIPMTSDLRSQKDALSTLSFFLDHLDTFPVSSFFLVFNHMDGIFNMPDSFIPVIEKHSDRVFSINLSKMKEPKIMIALYEHKKLYFEFENANSLNAKFIFPELDSIRAGRYASVIKNFSDTFYLELDRFNFAF